MYLFVGIYIFVHPIFATNETFKSYADAHLQLFVKQVERIYDVGEMVKKMHSLMHLL